jgi:signal recognition particle receptor subunit beta
MATFDRDRREIVLRIVYDGAATAGKTANLRSLHASFGHRAQGELYIPAETATGRTLYFDSLELLTGHVDEWPIRCQLLTVPGQFAFAERRYRLLRGIDAVIVVCESTPRGVQAARGAWTFLERALTSIGNARVPIVVQANKQDLPGALSPAEVEALLVLDPGHRVFPASALQGDGVRVTFLAALDAARDAVRERLRRAGPEALGPPMESAEQLYAAMLREVDIDPDPAVAAALDEALAALDESTSPGNASDTESSRSPSFSS